MLKAKIIDENGNISDYIFDSSDPDDKAIINALQRQDYISTYRIGNYDVLMPADGSGRAIVIGACPRVGDALEKRISCDLSDEQVRNIVASVSDGPTNLFGD